VDVGRWIITRETGTDGSWQQVGAATAFERPVLVGREGDLALGVTPEDTGVSRVALAVTAAAEGWRIEKTNRNGAVIHPWGLAASLAPAHLLLDWPLVAIRVMGSEASQQHWVLLESRTSSAGSGTRPRTPSPGAETAHSDPPKPLTPAEAEAIWTLFAEVLAWPPRLPALPLQLKQAARRLGITESGVQLRLEGAQRKALALGLPRPVRLTEPDYLHVLVGAGYLTPPPLSPVPNMLWRHGGHPA
jgi:hypothetical protein